jgi:hypothetical protein
VFGPEIAGDEQRLAALDAMTNPTAWNVLCTHHGLSLGTAKHVVADMIRALFGQPRDLVGEGDGPRPDP